MRKVRTAGYLVSVSTMAVLNGLAHDMLAALLLSPENILVSLCCYNTVCERENSYLSLKLDRSVFKLRIFKS